MDLLDDPRLPGRLRPLLLAAIAYFILPADVYPEDLHGPYGYIDDLYLCAFVADRVRGTLGESILLENWDGEAPLPELLDDVLAMKDEVIEAGWGRVLKYIGFDHLTHK